MIHLQTTPAAAQLLTPTQRTWLTTTTRSLFVASGSSPRAFANALLTDDTEIRAYNKTWRRIDAPTDVLSFPTHEGRGPRSPSHELGDLVVSVECAARLVATRDHAARLEEEVPLNIPWGLREEVLFLLIHGSLHLLGYDHRSPEEEHEMKARERALFRALHPDTRAAVDGGT